MENNYLSNALDSVNEKDAVAFKASLSQHLNSRLFTALQTRKAEVAKEIIGEVKDLDEANVISPSAPPAQGFARKSDTIKVNPKKSGAAKIPVKEDPKTAEMKLKMEMEKTKSMTVANKAKMAAVDVKKNVLGPKELQTMEKQIAAATDGSVDILSLKPVPGGFEVKTKQDDGIVPNLEKEYLMKTFKHEGKMVELKQVGLGFSRPIRAYIDGKRWAFFPSMEKAERMALEYINTMGESKEPTEESTIAEKVDLDGRTRLVRNTIARIEQYRKLRSERAKPATENKENKFAGIYDDGSGKGAFIPQPIDPGKQHPFFNKTVTEGVLDEFKSMFKKENITVREGDKEEYERFFKVAMKKFGISSPTDLKSPEQKKKFFDYVKKNYKGNN